MTARTEPDHHDPADLIARECLGFRIRLLSRTLSSLYDTALRPIGLTAGQLNVLVAIAKLGPLTPGEVAKRLSMEKSTLSRNLDRMRERDWIRTSPGARSNSHLLTISPSGRRLLKKALPLWMEAQDQATELLGSRGARSIRLAADGVRPRKEKA